MAFSDWVSLRVAAMQQQTELLKLSETERHNRVVEAETARANEADEAIKRETNVYNLKASQSRGYDTKNLEIQSYPFVQGVLQSNALELQRNELNYKAAETQSRNLTSIYGDNLRYAESVFSTLTNQKVSERGQDLSYKADVYRTDVQADTARTGQAMNDPLKYAIAPFVKNPSKIIDLGGNLVKGIAGSLFK